jgi:hypothetical protein
MSTSNIGRAERQERKDHPRPVLLIYNCSKARPCAFLPTKAPVAASPTPVVAHLPSVAPTTAPKDKKAAARKRFKAVYTIVRDELLADFRRQSMPEEVIDYYRRVRAPNTLFPFGYDVPADHPIEYGLHRPRR